MMVIEVKREKDEERRPRCDAKRWKGRRDGEKKRRGDEEKMRGKSDEMEGGDKKSRKKGVAAPIGGRLERGKEDEKMQVATMCAKKEGATVQTPFGLGMREIGRSRLRRSSRRHGVQFPFLRAKATRKRGKNDVVV